MEFFKVRSFASFPLHRSGRRMLGRWQNWDEPACGAHDLLKPPDKRIALVRDIKLEVPCEKHCRAADRHAVVIREAKGGPLKHE